MAVNTLPSPKEALAALDERDEREYSDAEHDQMMELYEDTFEAIEQGEIVIGKVLSIRDNAVLVDIGFKSEGVISLSEFGEPPAIEEGDEVEVFLESIEDQEGQVVLSKTKADFMRVWDRIRDAYDTEQMVEGRLMRRIKGGIVVDLFGVEAFLPGSQIDIKQVKNFDRFIGEVFPFRIIKLNKNRRNIVISRRVVLEEERARLRKQILATLEVGQIRAGTVKNITDFGAFIDLGGLDGLLHITDIAWGRVGHPSEELSIGQEIEVQVLNFDAERERISLGLKQLQDHPWKGVSERYKMDDKVIGKVVSITDYGAFVELEQGVEGLVHISEMSWTQHIRHPSKLVSISDEVEVMVLRVDEEGQKISLGLKQVQPDPWESLDIKYPAGTPLRGVVRNLTTFGAFVEIEAGIDGLVHISDLSWTKRIRHPSEVVRKGQEVDVIVINIDKDRRRISLGHKQTIENPWAGLAVTYAVGNAVSGHISHMLDRGAVVDLEGQVEGFVPSSQLGIDDLKRPDEYFAEGDELPLKVMEFDEDQKKIVLSVKERLRDAEPDEVAAFLEAHPRRKPAEGEAKGKAEAKGKGKAEAEGGAKGEAEAKAEGEAKGKAEAKEEGEAKGEAEAKAEAEAKGEAEAKAESEVKAEAEAEAEAESEAKREAEAKAEREKKKEAKEETGD